MIRLLVCDDHDMVRTGLIRALQGTGRFMVQAEASSPESLMGALQLAPHPEVLLLDLNLGNHGLAAGIELIGRLMAAYPRLPILVVSMHNEANIVQRALDAGAKGYVTKDSSLEVLEQALLHLSEGRSFLDPNLVGLLLSNARRSKVGAWNASLTQREREVMELLFEGLRVSDIALIMGLSVKTISTHKVRLMEKLNVSNNSDLVKLHMRHKVADQGPQ